MFFAPIVTTLIKSNAYLSILNANHTKCQQECALLAIQVTYSSTEPALLLLQKTPTAKPSLLKVAHSATIVITSTIINVFRSIRYVRPATPAPDYAYLASKATLLEMDSAHKHLLIPTVQNTMRQVHVWSAQINTIK